MTHRSATKDVFRATAVTVACVLPVFLTGGMAVQMGADLGFGVAGLGVAMSSFVGAQAILSGFVGRIADRIGATSALRLALVVVGLSNAYIAVAVGDTVGLVVGLAVAGAANALGQPAASRLLATSVRVDRQGLAFGIFQSSKPLAGLVGGVAVPTIALTVGWRWAFVGAAAGSFALLVIGGTGRRRVAVAPSATEPERLPLSTLVLLLVGIGFGFAAVKVFGSFLVDATVTAGVAPAAAGLLLAVGSALAIVTRLAVGVWADRRAGEHLIAVSVMLAVGTLGFLLLATASVPTMVVGTLLVASGAWGYNGLFYLSVTRLMSRTPAAITGVMLSGASAGGFFGPLLFGVLVHRWSYSTGWAAMAVATAAAATLIRLAVVRLTRAELGPAAIEGA